MKSKEEVVRETFTTRLNPDLISRIKHLAVDLKTPINHLLEIAIRIILKEDQATIKKLLKENQAKK